MTRRGLFKRSAVVGGSLVAIGGGVDRFAPRYSPLGRARALGKAASFALGVSGVAGMLVGAGYMLGSGSSDDAAETINEARGNELHDRIWTDANEMQMTQTPMLESISGDVSMLRQICRSDAAFALMQAASDQKSDANALADAEAAIRDAVAGVEGNFFDAFTSQIEKIFTRAELANSEGELDLENVMTWDNDNSTDDQAIRLLTGSEGGSDVSNFYGSAREASVELVNGDTQSVSCMLAEVYVNSVSERTITMIAPWDSATSVSFADGAPHEWTNDMLTNIASNQDSANHNYPYPTGVEIWARESSDMVPAIKAEEWMQIHSELHTLLDEEIANAATMRDAFYQEALNGEIALHEMSSASAILEAADTLDNWKQAAGAYRAMRMPEATDPAVIKLENGVELEGLLFWSDPDPDEGLVVDQITNPDNTIGRIYMAAEIRSVPETPESETYDVTVTVVDDDTDATTLEGISITVKGTDATATTDANGKATLSLPEGPRTLYLSGADSGGTSHETGQTVEVSSENTSFEITHDGGDRTSVQADPLAGKTLTQENVGDVVIPYLTKPFTVVGIHERPDASNLMFEEPDRVEPDDDFDTQVDNSRQAGEDEEETREETTKIVIENTGGGGPGPIFGGGNPLEGGGGLLGLGIIGVVILAVIGIVTDAIPGLGN